MTSSLVLLPHCSEFCNKIVFFVSCLILLLCLTVCSLCCHAPHCAQIDPTSNSVLSLHLSSFVTRTILPLSGVICAASGLHPAIRCLWTDKWRGTDSNSVGVMFVLSPRKRIFQILLSEGFNPADTFHECSCFRLLVAASQKRCTVIFLQHILHPCGCVQKFKFSTALLPLLAQPPNHPHVPKYPPFRTECVAYTMACLKSVRRKEKDSNTLENT